MTVDNGKMTVQEEEVEAFCTYGNKLKYVMWQYLMV